MPGLNLRSRTGLVVRGRLALVGHTGFIGKTLDHSGRFTDRYNRSNLDQLRGSYDHIVVSAPSAEKWRANAEPSADWSEVSSLIEALQRTCSRKLTLISTIDATELSPYGRNRRALEEALWCESQFTHPNLAIIRLPALFGPGLKKNALYDLLMGESAKGGQYQWFPVEDLWKQIEKVDWPGRSIVKLYSEPVRMEEIVERFFPDRPWVAGVWPTYDERPYCMTKEKVLTRMGEFISQWTSASA